MELVILIIFIQIFSSVCAHHTGPTKVWQILAQKTTLLKIIFNNLLACSTPTDENSKNLEEFLQNFMKNNFDVYQVTDEEGQGMEEELEENDDDSLETINLDETDQQTESIVLPEKEEVEIEAIIEIP